MKSDSHGKVALVAAVLVGLFAIIAVNKYIDGKTKVTPKPQASILVSTMEIAEGGEIGPEMLSVAQIPFEALSNIHIALPGRDEPDFQTAFEDAKSKVVGRRAKRLVAANSPIFWLDIDTEQKVPFADLIGEGNRAVTMPVDQVSSVCGFIKPGSRVDVVLTSTEAKLGLLTRGAAGGGDQVVTSVILQNVPVISTDRVYDLQSSSSGYGTITLNLPMKAALMLIQARTMGQITYLLRNVRDTKSEADRLRLTIGPGQSFGEAVRQQEAR